MMSHPRWRRALRFGAVLARKSKIGFIDDGSGKPVAIRTHIGRRPTLASMRGD